MPRSCDFAALGLNPHTADIVIAINHGGINTAPYTEHMENAGWYLAQVPGIDVVLLGHSHDIFPNPSDPKSHYANLKDVDNTRGTRTVRPRATSSRRISSSSFAF